MSWKCDINIKEAEVVPFAPVVADDILKSMDIEEKGWKYDYVRGYTFFGSVSVADDVVKDGELTIRFNVVGRHFDCSSCELESLEGCPETVGGNFDCRNNLLTSLEGCPETVGGDFNCDDNLLTSLEGSPKSVGGDFDCTFNELTTLEGCPKTVDGDFDCYHNQLTSLKGCPETVGGRFVCACNRLTSLEGCPKIVGDFKCDNNAVEFTPDEVEAVCDVKIGIYC